MMESNARATKDRPTSSRTAPDVLDDEGDAGEDVSAADWTPDEADLAWLELGGPIEAVPDDPVMSVGDGAVADPVGPPLEMLCDACVGDPGARTLVLLGELEDEGEFGTPEGDAVIGKGGSEGAIFSASPIVQ